MMRQLIDNFGGMNCTLTLITVILALMGAAISSTGAFIGLFAGLGISIHCIRKYEDANSLCLFASVMAAAFALAFYTLFLFISHKLGWEIF